MNQNKSVVGFLGAGGIAHAHAFSLSSIRYYYDDSPEVELEAVCSATESHRQSFSGKYGFARALPLEEFVESKKINTVFILGPNNVHYQHLESVLNMPEVRNVYLEKPVCSTVEEELNIADIVKSRPDVKIQVGFQYLFSTQIREAISLWKSGITGKPVHFEIKYYHGDYLRRDYRAKRTNRLTPAPGGGAMADLGSHAISLLIAFLGNRIEIISGLQAGHFIDVPEDSDLFSQINIFDAETSAAGTLSASRISSGTGDLISFEMYGEKGAIKFSTHSSDYFEFYTEETGQWTRIITGSNYRPECNFPSHHVPPGWLRSMVHAHYVFLTGNQAGYVIPDINHGLAVQRIVRETAYHLSEFRKRTSQFKTR